MNYWLMKSEPNTYSWSDLVRDGKTCWDGVRNYQARNYIREMRPKDQAFFYHSVKERLIVGVVRILSEPYADPTAKGEDWSVVDLVPLFPLKEPVSLDQIKKEKVLQEMVLLKNSRLSVQPVSREEFQFIVSVGGKGHLTSSG